MRHLLKQGKLQENSPISYEVTDFLITLIFSFRMELLENQAKQYNWEQDQIAHMKNYIARFGHGSAKLARQAQSKEKTLAKMVAQGLTEKVINDKVLNFYFPSCGTIPPPVIMVQNVSFRYNEDAPWIYKNLEFGIDLDTRLALVGPNGAGKSTLLKLLYGDVCTTKCTFCLLIL